VEEEVEEEVAEVVVAMPAQPRGPTQ